MKTLLKEWVHGCARWCSRNGVRLATSTFLSCEREVASPSSKPLLSVLLGDLAVLLGCLDPALHLLDHVEVVLDVFERALVGQLLEQGFYFLLGNTHGGGLGRGRCCLV